jgi:hypothetical protein
MKDATINPIAILKKDATINTIAIMKLFNGTFERGGVVLTREECQTLWQILIGQRKVLPRGRRPDPKIEDRDKAIARLVTLHVAGGRQSKAAVAEVAKYYGVSRTQVYVAMKEHSCDAADIDPAITE